MTDTQLETPSSFLHDLRTPLNQIIGYAEMLVEQARDGGQSGFVPDLEKVLAASARMLAIIDNGPGQGLQHPVEPSQTPVEASQLSAKPSQTSAEAPQLSAEAPQTPVEAPQTPAEAPQTPVEAPQTSEKAPQLGGLILVVDDDENNRDVLSRRLEKEGYAVANAANGQSALEMLVASPYDMVLLDIMMPELDGYEVLRRMKANERLEHIPVIMISALGEMDSVARCIEMGADDYLSKPFNPVLLRARVGASLEKKRGRDREMDLFDQLQKNFDRLQQLETMRDDLTHMIIHDLRTPLTSVTAAMQTLDVVGEVNDAQREVMTIAVNGADSLLATINSLLDVEQLESGAMKLDLTLLSLPEFIESAVLQVRPLAEEKNVTLLQQLEPELPWLQADEDKLGRTLVNLLGNAIKFTPSEGSVTLEVKEVGQSVRFCVRDTGEGIPAEHLDRIFEKFAQVESRQGGRQMSSGLGLTFCKLAVETHGGQIGVESTPGAGSEFSFSIPLTGGG